MNNSNTTNNWPEVPIGQTGKVLGGRQRSPHAIGSSQKYLRVANVFDGYIDSSDIYEMPFSEEEAKRFLLEPGDILLNEGQSLELVGRSAIYRGDPPNCCFQNTLVRYRAGPDVLPEFAQYTFQNFLRLGKFAAIASQTTSIAHLGAGRFAALPMPVPPLEEQRAIASALSDMDTLLAKLDQLIAKKRDIKQAAMQELLTGRRRLPGFSGGWTMTALRSLGAWKGGATPSMVNPDFWVNGSMPWASSADIKSTTIDTTTKTITELAVESSSTTVIPTGSVVMVTRSGILRRYFPVAKTSKPIAINQDIKALIPASGVDTEFVLQSLLLHGPDILSSCMKAGTTVESVELSWLKAYEIDLPSLDEQQAIAALLRDMDTEITTLEARREKTRLIKQGMMQELLSGRVRLI